MVDFTAGEVEVEVEVDNPAARSFLALLPRTLEFSDCVGKEKVADPTWCPPEDAMDGGSRRHGSVSRRFQNTIDRRLRQGSSAARRPRRPRCRSRGRPGRLRRARRRRRRPDASPLGP
ncbi:MAG: hypothetical protein JST33_10685 [Actinobacteria bacterium]|nr:hypothetical protein [Actinomycetota bacterium]